MSINTIKMLERKHNSEIICQRINDGYVNATAMCKSYQKEWSNYRQNSNTDNFISALEGSLGIPGNLLITSIVTGPNENRGTWIHPQIAIHLAMWLSADFAVTVTDWVLNWMLESKDNAFGSEKLTEDQKRSYLRKQIKEHNKLLSSTAKQSGVINYGKFHNSGYKGLYDNRTKADIASLKGLSKNDDILDFMGSTELAANFFRITQTEEKLRSDIKHDESRANNIHYAVGKKVREAMLDISGIAPENLPKADSIKLLTNKKLDGNNINHSKKKIDISKDLWKYALLVIAREKNKSITTTKLIEEIPKYIILDEKHVEQLKGRKDNKFSQLVRNIKSHKTSTTNPIYKGYLEEIEGGLKITEQGIEFVKDEFKEYLNNKEQKNAKK